MKRLRALTLALIAPAALSACGSCPEPRVITKTETVEVAVPAYVPLPEADTAPCPVPAFPDQATVGAYEDLIARLYTSLHACNESKAAIREAQP